MNWIQKEERFIFQTYRRQPVVLTRGKGAYVWDLRGRKYLDFFSGLGVNNVGHCHPEVMRAIVTQSRKLIHTSNLYYTLPQIRCAEQLVRKTFSGKVFFSNSGAEANECALKLSRRWGKKFLRQKVKSGGRFEIITFENSFHGRSMGTLTLTGQEKFRKGFDPLLERVRYAKFNDIESVKKNLYPGTCAIFVEPVQGEGGVNPADKSFLKSLRQICDQNRILLIFDEVQCGLGRTGHLFAFQYFGVVPDVLTVAKGLGGGLPIGATIAKKKIADLLGRGDHASTFGGNPVACASAGQVLKIIDKRLLSSVKEKSNYLFVELRKMQERFPRIIREVRGIGLMIGVELFIPGDAGVKACRENGLLINCTQEKILRFLPPLTISVPEIKFALAILNKSIYTAS